MREGSYGMYGWWLGALPPTAADEEVEEKPSIGLSIGRSSSMVLKLREDGEAQDGGSIGFTRPAPQLDAVVVPMPPLKPSNDEDSGVDTEE